MATQPAVSSRTADALALGINDFSELFQSIVANVSTVLQGKEDPTRLALVCLVSEGHLLLEDVPGVGKTSLAKALANSFDVQWRRIQFTPDLLPSDITGSSVFDRGGGSFTFRPGAVFANVVLGDEINRASPKTQSALLEAMQEGQVTVDNTTYRLPSPFLVIATQNPLEHEGTYPLPESQLDRFLLRVKMGYPDRNAEIAMLEVHGINPGFDDLPAVASPDAIASMVSVVNAVHMAPSLKGYIVDIAAATRAHPTLALGMSPRAALGLQRSSRALAAASGREYVIPDDIKALIVPVLAHRLLLSAEAAVSGLEVEEVLAEVVRSVPVPSGRSLS